MKHHSIHQLKTMNLRVHPELIFNDLNRNFSSIEQFDELVRSSAFYYREHGSLNLLKIFIPNNRQNTDGYAYLHNWTPEMAEQAAEDVIKFFTKTHLISDSYLKDVQHDGIYLGFTTETSAFLRYGSYIGDASYIISKGREKGIHITADEWLRDFPFEFHAAWYNRIDIVKTIVAWLDEPENELFKKAMYDGRQNWLETKKYAKIDNWNPKGEFIKVFTWKFNDTSEKKQELLAKFKAEFN